MTPRLTLEKLGKISNEGHGFSRAVPFRTKDVPQGLRACVRTGI